MKTLCNCPYVVCPLYGNCAACIQKNRKENEMAHCMESKAIQMGAKFPVRHPKTIIEKDFEGMSRKTAELIAGVVQKKPNALLCLPAGSTAIRTYEILKEMREKGQVDFSKCSFVALDEWLDLKDESENCRAFLEKYFYKPLEIKEKQITFFHTHASDFTEECRRVDQIIFNHGGIDCLLLGIGINGHLGLNEPNQSFDSYCKVVNLDATTQQVGQKYFSGQIRLTRGITLGVRHFYGSHFVILQAGGAHKKEIIRKTYETTPTEALPATVMALLPNAVVVLDRDAASGICEIIGEENKDDE